LKAGNSTAFAVVDTAVAAVHTPSVAALVGCTSVDSECKTETMLIGRNSNSVDVFLSLQSPLVDCCKEVVGLVVGGIEVGRVVVARKKKRNLGGSFRLLDIVVVVGK